MRDKCLLSFCLVVSTLVGANIHASSRAGERDLHDLLSVKSLDELTTQTRRTSARDLAQTECAAELAARLIPRACFRELALTPTRASATDLRAARLARVCMENARASQSRLDLSGPLRELPLDCVRVVGERLEDLHYKDESVSPETSVMRTSGPILEDDPME